MKKSIKKIIEAVKLFFTCDYANYEGPGGIA